MTDWIGAADAARRLGIKPASLYSYVSRGVLARRPGPDGRTSVFDAAEVEALARKGRPRRPAGGSGLIIGSALTEISGDSFRYRGLDVTMLARQRSFEDVAELLWTGALPGAPGPPWRATAEAVAVAAAAQSALPAGTLPLERLQVIVPALAATDQLRLELGRPAVTAAGRAMIAGMAECLPAMAPSAPPASELSVAGRLAARLCPGEPGRGLVAVIGSALVLLADHELPASTLAARAAASVRADPYAVVATGLGAVGGALHGGASLGAELMLASAREPSDVPRIVGGLLRRGERIPGFGHFVYRSGDPRAITLLAQVRALVPGSPVLAVADAVLAESRRRSLPEPNIDFALAVLAGVAGMTRGAGEAIFAVARAAGWIAHALEEYERATPIRPRSIYTGPMAPGEPTAPGGPVAPGESDSPARHSP